MKRSSSILALRPYILLAVAFLVACDGGESTEQAIPTTDGGQTTVQPTSTTNSGPVTGQLTPTEGRAAAGCATLSSGRRHTCGLREDSSVMCWGDNQYGQASPPERETVAAISSGRGHPCGLREDGPVLCWGDLPVVIHP